MTTLDWPDLTLPPINLWSLPMQDLMQVIKHKKNGKRYKKLYEALAKIDGVWIDAVVYQSCYDDEVYVRTIKDFGDSFDAL